MEFLLFIPDVKIHTGHMVGEVKFNSFRVFFRSQKKKRKVKIQSNLISFQEYTQSDFQLVKEIDANADVSRDIHEMRRCLNQLVQGEIFALNYCPPK